MKARLPREYRATKDIEITNETILKELITELIEFKKCEAGTGVCTPNSRSFVGSYFMSPAYKVLKSECEEELWPFCNLICEALRQTIIIKEIADNSAAPNVLCNSFIDACEKASDKVFRMTGREYVLPASLYVDMYTLCRETSFLYLVEQSKLDTSGIAILTNIINLYTISSDYSSPMKTMIDAWLCEYKDVPRDPARAIAYKACMPRSHAFNRGDIFLPTDKERYPFVTEASPYESLNGSMDNLPIEELRKFFPDAESVDKVKISTLESFAKTMLATRAVESQWLEHRVKYMNDEYERYCSEAYNARVKYERNSNRQKSSKNEKEVVYVDKIVKDTSETDELRSKVQSYKAHISALEEELSTIKSSSDKVATLAEENAALKSYIECMESAEEVDDNTADLSSEDMAMLSSIKANLVLPDLKSLKVLQQMLPNSTFVYIPTSSMYKADPPKNCDVYLMCTGMCSHKSFYNWRGKVKDWNYTICPTAGIVNICKCLLAAYKGENHG